MMSRYPVNVRPLRLRRRSSIYLEAILRSDGGTNSVAIVNVSEGGIGLTGVVSNISCQTATLAIPTLQFERKFEVAWCKDGKLGLSFPENFSPRERADFVDILTAHGRSGLDMSDCRLGPFVGCSEVMKAVLWKIERAALTNAPVFITGETGTGKDVCAQAIHQRSERKNSPYVPINCAVFSENFSASDLFGHKKGAFTGATYDRAGAVDRARTGTIFFDEFGEMEMREQAKLLRFVQSGEYQRIGEDTVRTSDVRIICATNRSPREEISRGRLREDLYYRLNVIPIHLPPVRERRGDAILLAQHFLNVHSLEFGRNAVHLDGEALAWIARYHWPGNVRQISNAIKQCIALTPNSTISWQDIENAIGATAPNIASPAAAPLPKIEEPSDVAGQTLDTIIQQAIDRAIQKHGSIPRAARVLDVSPSTIYRRFSRQVA